VNVPMTCGERWQLFGLAPWHAVTFRLAQNTGANFGLESAIPVLDVIGVRYQRGAGRLQSVRAGLGVMYFKDQVETQATAATPTGATVIAPSRKRMSSISRWRPI